MGLIPFPQPLRTSRRDDRAWELGEWPILRKGPKAWAALFALILIPVIAAVGFIAWSNIGNAIEATMAALILSVLAFGVLGGLFRMAQGGEREDEA